MPMHLDGQPFANPTWLLSRRYQYTLVDHLRTSLGYSLVCQVLQHVADGRPRCKDDHKAALDGCIAQIAVLLPTSISCDLSLCQVIEKPVERRVLAVVESIQTPYSASKTTLFFATAASVLDSSDLASVILRVTGLHAAAHALSPLGLAQSTHKPRDRNPPLCPPLFLVLWMGYDLPLGSLKINVIFIAVY